MSACAICGSTASESGSTLRAGEDEWRTCGSGCYQKAILLDANRRKCARCGSRIHATTIEALSGKIGSTGDARWTNSYFCSESCYEGGPWSMKREFLEYRFPPADSGGAKSGCFIATVAFGDPGCREVAVLRKYRDVRLLTSTSGRAVVAVYYFLGPYLAACVSRSTVCRGIVRRVLTRIVAHCDKELTDHDH